MPSIKKLDNGMTRRIRVINYPFQFVEIPINSTDRKVNIKLKDDFKNDELLKDAFLQILIRYAAENINLNNIDQPEQVKESIGNYIEENNPIKAFLNEHYDITNNNRDKILCSDFVRLVNSESNEKSSAVKIKKDMAFNGFEQQVCSGNKYYYGLVEKAIGNVFDNQSDTGLDG